MAQIKFKGARNPTCMAFGQMPDAETLSSFDQGGAMLRDIVGAVASHWANDDCRHPDYCIGRDAHFMLLRAVAAGNGPALAFYAVHALGKAPRDDS